MPYGSAALLYNKSVAFSSRAALGCYYAAVAHSAGKPAVAVGFKTYPPVLG